MSADWKIVEQVFNELYERQGYTNHGSLAQKFEAQLEAILKVSHAVCVANPAIALTMALESLGLRSVAVVTPTMSRRSKNALQWAQLEYETDLDNCSNTGGLLIDADCLGEVLKLGKLAVDKPWVIDATGKKRVQTVLPVKSARLSPRLIVYSFVTGHDIEADGAACIATDCADTAELLRNIRSSYGVREARSVVKTANGRMSEAQAALGLISLGNSRGE